jgi:diaminopimelate epimerase
MIFYKTSSFGNDFIEINQEELSPKRTGKSALARAICDRQRGVGADGVVFYRIKGGAPRFEIFNKDGSAAELSGNGMAGLAVVLWQRRLASSPLVLKAAAGRRHVVLVKRRRSDYHLDVEIGRPDFADRGFFPFLGAPGASYSCTGVEFHPVSVGNPHAVVLLPRMPAAARLAALGRTLESHPMFPRRVNVEFVHLAPGESSRVFFFERGVGPTLASSTGSAAVFAVLRRLGKIHDHLDIELDVDSTAEDPAGKEDGSHREGCPAGGCAEAIHVRWEGGIHVRILTRLVCRGEYFL